MFDHEHEILEQNPDLEVVVDLDQTHDCGTDIINIALDRGGSSLPMAILPETIADSPTPNASKKLAKKGKKGSVDLTQQKLKKMLSKKITESYIDTLQYMSDEIYLDMFKG